MRISPNPSLLVGVSSDGWTAFCFSLCLGCWVGSCLMGLPLSWWQSSFDWHYLLWLINLIYHRLKWKYYAPKSMRSMINMEMTVRKSNRKPWSSTPKQGQTPWLVVCRACCSCPFSWGCFTFFQLPSPFVENPFYGRRTCRPMTPF